VHIIGAGPVGLYTAYLAGIKGFEVNLYEKSDKLGGLFDVISAPPGKYKWQWFKKFLLHQVRQMDNIKVMKNYDISFEKTYQISEDDYIFDCSSVKPKREFAVDKVKVPVYDVTEIINAPLTNMKDKNIIILGSRGAGLEAAHYLANQGNQVTVIARSGPEAN